MKPKKSFFKKTLIRILTGTGILVFLLAITAALVLQNPQWLINQRNLERAQKWLAPTGLVLSYQDFEFEVLKDRGLFRKKVQMKVGEMHLSYPPRIRELDVSHADVTLAYDLFHKGFVTEFGPGNVVVKNFTYIAPPGKTSSGFAEYLRKKLIPERFRKTDFDHFSFVVEKFKIVRKTLPDVTGAADVKIASHERRLETLTANGWTKEIKGVKRNYAATLKVNPTFDEWGGTLDYSQGKTELGLAANLDKSGRLSGNVDFQNAVSSAKIAFDGTKENGSYFLNGKGNVAFTRRNAPKVALERCGSRIKPDGNRESAALDLSCDVNMTFPSFDASASVARSRKTPYGRFEVGVNSKSVPLNDFAKPAAFHATLKARPEAGVISRKIEAELDLKGPLNRMPEAMDVKGNLDLEIDVNEFAELVALLRDTPLAVPAPFNVLRGKASIEAQGRIESLDRENEFTYATKLDLASPQQKLKMTGKGKALIGIKNPSFVPELAIEIDDSAIILPPLNAVSVPQLMPDSRIVTKPPRAKGPLVKNYDITVKSKTGTALLVKNRYASGGAPVTFDMHLKPKEWTGKVAVKTFTAEIFRSKAKIENFELKLAPELRKSGLAGLIHVERAAYDIAVQVLGSVERPRVIMESDPPLSQQDIVSVLLYGDTLDELGEGDAQQAKDVKSGLSQRAFGLGSLFLFASTPVQKISYDPYTKTATVKFRLGKGSALLLKHQDNVQGVSFQQKLGKHLVLKTELETTFDATQDEEKKAKKGTFIEWFKRY